MPRKSLSHKQEKSEQEMQFSRSILGAKVEWRLGILRTVRDKLKASQGSADMHIHLSASVSLVNNGYHLLGVDGPFADQASCGDWS